MESPVAKNIAECLGGEKLELFRKLNLLEQHRVESFKSWPFPDTASCSIAKMAEAGFYWTGNKRENDTATCFVCGKTLDGWEAKDDPWWEHQTHAPQCEFAKLSCAEKDLTVSQFLEILGLVAKCSMGKTCKGFKTSFVRENEDRLKEYTQNQK
ncbi:baculoviral IAP repeat-containing protein 5 [Drosophila eugracilis]|uniref:baculoviral IAP repeat-containing protein 5 n=1 Tax=Drosophila eugracilis TaxID=29029 RepID=UPI0007E6B767|nr:baculoviral IAP repeat-containing protein 5 [Drosophila eugracilis]